MNDTASILRLSTRVCARARCSTSGFRIGGDGSKRLGTRVEENKYDQRSVVDRVGFGVCINMNEMANVDTYMYVCGLE